MRGSFKPPTKVHVDMSKAATAQFKNAGGVSGRGILSVAEITMSELASDGEQDDVSFLARVDLLAKLGFNVLISDYLRFFRLRSWLRNFTENRIGIALSVHDFNLLFDEKYYEGLEGGILEAMGKLFSDDTNVYVYPAKISGALVTLDTVNIPENLKYLLKHLIFNRSLISIDNYQEENLHILARELVKDLPNGRGAWEACLPEGVAEEIIEKKLFGYRD